MHLKTGFADVLWGGTLMHYVCKALKEYSTDFKHQDHIDHHRQYDLAQFLDFFMTSSAFLRLSKAWKNISA